MIRFEDLTRGMTIKGILPDHTVTIVDLKWHGSTVVEATYKDANGRLGNELLYRDREPSLEIVASGTPFVFEGDGNLFQLAAEARRISLAYLFDPILAIHTSLIDPLPHQITAVYEEMLQRQPLRFLLADDPGAGKTIMAGLLIKELMIRGDLGRCLIVCPGSLAEQWQDELQGKFQLSFDIVGRSELESSRSGNPFVEKPLVISRLDLMSRNDEIIARLEKTDWDLVVVDEAHKLHASFSNNDVKETKRYKLGKLLGQKSRHFLLMTATPHNGKEEEFQLFMALLDGDRFEGKFRDGVHKVDVSDLMRRLTKESLVRFDGTPLFPERFAYTVNYALSDLEARLYNEVTQYVREEFNRADQLEQGRKGTIGFALTILQRRLASSPAAIYQSLKNRRERLEKRLREEKLMNRGAKLSEAEESLLSDDDLEDLEDTPNAETEEAKEKVVDQSTAAQTISELEAEIVTLKLLESLASTVRQSRKDKKWERLAEVLQNTPEMFYPDGHRRKLVIFTEHRPTLDYLVDRLQTLLGQSEAVVSIHGGVGREERLKIQERFTQDKSVQILVATDAAGEGINLQRAHLMVNYDLPWNPNRLEQRFGRIHRIGQTEVCHLWNLVANETREGEVFDLLLRKISEQRNALGGRVFDVLGKVFQETPLRDLLIEAVRYGDREEVRARLHRVLDESLNQDHLRDLLEDHALIQGALTSAKVQEIREAMERADARRLQPHFISSFFLEGFRHLGGTIRERESRRYEITHVPAVIRNRDRQIGRGAPISPKYERVTFHKDQISVEGKPLAAFICPGQPLLDATIDLVLERYRDLLRTGTILVDPQEDTPGGIRVLFFLEHTIQDARIGFDGNRRIVSRQMQFVELEETGQVRMAEYAPYLDYRPITDEERQLVSNCLEAPWLKENLEQRALTFAIETLVPRHLGEVKAYKESLVAKIMAAVKDRLTKEINYWDRRAQDLKEQEESGKPNARINSAKARERADDLELRLRKRLEELEQERRLSPLPPHVTGGALIVPKSLLLHSKGDKLERALFARETERVERLAMEAVLAKEIALGREPRDVSAENRGYDIESRDLRSDHLLFIEVKGRVQGATTVTITKNEILTGLNKPENYVLGLVIVGEDGAHDPVYISNPFRKDLDFGVTSVNYDLKDLLTKDKESLR